PSFAICRNLPGQSRDPLADFGFRKDDPQCDSPQGTLEFNWPDCCMMISDVALKGIRFNPRALLRVGQNPPYDVNPKNRLSTLAVICDTASSTRIELGQVIDPTEKTWPP